MTLTKAPSERGFNDFKKTIKTIILITLSLWLLGVLLVAGGLTFISSFTADLYPIL